MMSPMKCVSGVSFITFCLVPDNWEGRAKEHPLSVVTLALQNLALQMALGFWV